MKVKTNELEGVALEAKKEYVRKTRSSNYENSMRLEGITQEKVDRIKALVEGVEVDLDKPLDEED